MPVQLLKVLKINVSAIFTRDFTELIVNNSKQTYEFLKSLNIYIN